MSITPCGVQAPNPSMLNHVLAKFSLVKPSKSFLESIYCFVHPKPLSEDALSLRTVFNICEY